MQQISAPFGGLPHAKLLSPWVTNVTDGNPAPIVLCFFLCRCAPSVTTGQEAIAIKRFVRGGCDEKR